MVAEPKATHVVPTDDLDLANLVSDRQQHFPPLREEEVVASVDPVLQNSHYSVKNC